jgi:hypothetical protein
MPWRDIEKELYRLIIESEFNFLGNNFIHLSQIYELVRLEFPENCDDNNLCTCRHQIEATQPEWKHIVRSALSKLKVRQIVERGAVNGFWRVTA